MPPPAERCAILTGRDLVSARLLARKWADAIGMSETEATKIVTAASELARNALIHGGGGTMVVETVEKEGRTGLRLSFVDQGPGISDIALAMKDGWSSGKSLGLGLPGAKRLVDAFDIRSEPGRGTQIVVTKWRTDARRRYA